MIAEAPIRFMRTTRACHNRTTVPAGGSAATKLQGRFNNWPVMTERWRNNPPPLLQEPPPRCHQSTEGAPPGRMPGLAWLGEGFLAWLGPA